jgi:uncharacterized cysteine cluster protein YcgN (CxxCxxCC family)
MAWDAICMRCGRCCFEKIDFEGTIYYTDIPCEHFDPNTRLCQVYADRERVRKGCIQLTSRDLDKGFLPADCPYVAGRPDYKAPILFEDD